MSLSLRFISDEKLISAYSKAKELKLDFEFIKFLEDEINRRNLTEIFQTTQIGIPLKEI
jgi:arsenate reductase-like glutaredoxin family protein